MQNLALKALERSMRRPPTFKKTDVTRATNAVLAAGLHVARVEINKDGLIAVVPAKSEEPATANAEDNEWDCLDDTPSPAIRARVS
jgi:hypothetical protein